MWPKSSNSKIGRSGIQLGHRARDHTLYYIIHEYLHVLFEQVVTSKYHTGCGHASRTIKPPHVHIHLNGETPLSQMIYNPCPVLSRRSHFASYRIGHEPLLCNFHARLVPRWLTQCFISEFASNHSLYFYYLNASM